LRVLTHQRNYEHAQNNDKAGCESEDTEDDLDITTVRLNNQKSAEFLGWISRPLSSRGLRDEGGFSLYRLPETSGITWSRTFNKVSAVFFSLLNIALSLLPAFVIPGEEEDTLDILP
jgi:hypothetical protein